MLIDNLKDINSAADLFTYICEIEEQLEAKTKQVSNFLRELERKDTLVRRFAEEAGYKSIYEEKPPHGKPLRVYITRTKTDGGTIGQFTTARYSEAEGLILRDFGSGWTISYWKVLD